MWCAGDRCNFAGSNEDRGRSGTPGAEDRGWLSTCQVFGGRMIERSGGVVSDLHRAQGDDERGFLALASNQGRRFQLFWPQNRWL
jgi:hypothetical protein